MREFTTIVESVAAPSTDKLWINNGVLKYYDGASWKAFTSSGCGCSIEISKQNTWVINGVDTGKPSKGVNGYNGEDGITPKIGPNGNWWICNTDTGVLASGSNGKPGEAGENGITPHIGSNYNWFIADEDTGVLARGTNGKDGEQGPIGPPGDKGEPGPQGKPGVGARTVFAFKVSSTIPATPTGGSWDPETDVVTYPVGWSGDDTQEGTVWMSHAIFNIDGQLDKGGWSKPIRMTGEDGTNGTDGTSIEFIFKLTKNTFTEPSKPDNDPNTTGYVPEGWTDHPQGISIEMQAEWVCSRTKGETVWSDWDGPSLWSKWGTDGRDGDGVEYIYQRKNNALPPARPTEVSQEPEFVPTGWTDNPTGVDSTYQWEWVCLRKYRDGQWGEFSNPALWAKYGEDGTNGENGNSIRIMYAKTDGSDETPPVIADNINPGSIWGTAMPNYTGNEAVWGIQATVSYDNKLVTNWQGPYLITGVNGKDGIPVNYKTYVFRKSDDKPLGPTSNDPNNPGNGWVDYPDSVGNWWQCIGSVNGVTGLVTEWSEVLPLNGKDGTAQDGKFTEFRFAKSTTDTAPSLDKTARNPSGWTTSFPTLNAGEIMFMTKAVINPDGVTLYSNWEDPVRISGERGPQGNTGPAGQPGAPGSQGVSGIPGVSYELRYSLGIEDGFDATWNSTVASTRNPSSYGWTTELPATTEAKPYIWMTQARIKLADNDDTVGSLQGTWSEPFRLSGVNGLDGAPGPAGKKGQVVYPMGVYSNTTSYTTTDTKAPYVYDPSDGNFYVLNAEMTWLGTEQDNRTPSQDFAANGGKYWLKFDSFEAIYAKIGIIANGLIGSAVFNGDYMFSQQGVDASGSPSSNYEQFTGEEDSPFKPNLLVDFNKGDLTYKGVSQVLAYTMTDGENLTVNSDFTYNSIIPANNCTITFNKNGSNTEDRNIEVLGSVTYNYSATGMYVNRIQLEEVLQYVTIVLKSSISFDSSGVPYITVNTTTFGTFNVVANNRVVMVNAATIFGSGNLGQTILPSSNQNIDVYFRSGSDYTNQRKLYPFKVSGKSALPVRLSALSSDFERNEKRWWSINAQLVQNAPGASDNFAILWYRIPDNITTLTSGVAIIGSGSLITQDTM